MMHANADPADCEAAALTTVLQNVLVQIKLLGERWTLNPVSILVCVLNPHQQCFYVTWQRILGDLYSNRVCWPRLHFLSLSASY